MSAGGGDLDGRQRRRPLTATLIIAAVIGVAVLAYVGLVAALYLNQEKLIFPAQKLDPDYKFVFDQEQFEEMRVNVPGAVLHALHFMQPAPRGLVFFLHGNGGDLSTWTTGLDFYRSVGYDLFIFDYRGYGRSTGRIESEAQLHADARAMWNAIAPSYQARKLPIVVYGRSLGTGLAVPLARDVEPALVILATPFISLAAAAARAYPFVPQSLLKYPLRSDLTIADVKSPIVFVHGSNDALIPIADSERLMRLARAPVELLRIEGAGHNDVHLFPAYITGLEARLNQLAAR